MPWATTGIESLRMDFVMIARDPDASKSETCRQFGISRRTGYKWLRRYEAEGLMGLRDRCRRPMSSPLRASGDIVTDIVKLRGKREERFRGPKKIRALLLRRGTGPDEVPSVATIGRILRRAGLSERKGRGRPAKHLPTGVLTSSEKPNDVWTVDLKGWWRAGDGRRCEPLTVRDLHSRYLLCLRPVARRSTEEVRPVFEEVFGRYGLPGIIRCDNGSPFASLVGLCGLTRLSAWWQTLGIKLERIDPGHPEQNGGHERMHRDIAEEVQRRPAASVAEEAERLERWRVEFNNERPHEALGMKVPAEVYHPSGRKLHDVRQYVYPLDYERRRVRRDGCLRMRDQTVYLSAALAKQEVGLERLDGSCWRVWLCDLAVCEIIRAGDGLERRPVTDALPSDAGDCNPCPDNKVYTMSGP